VVCDGNEIRGDHLVLQRRTPITARPTSTETPASATTVAPVRAASSIGTINIPRTGMTMDEIEREAIRITLLNVEGNQSRAARVLGISRATLLRKLHKYSLNSDSRHDHSQVA
jgi:DNA-binding NtrC family response regulator